MPNYSGLFRVEDSFALNLITAFLDTNGTEALDWEPQTIREEIEADFGVVPSQLVLDKVQAAITILTTDQEFTYWEPFEEITHVLNGYEADFEGMRPPTPEELAWAVLETCLIDPPEEPLTKAVSGEVVAYIATILKSAGFYKSPETLQFVDMAKWCCDPLAEHKELSTEIKDVHRVKLLRVQAYVADRYEKLKAESREYFATSLPDLSTLLERQVPWR